MRSLDRRTGGLEISEELAELEQELDRRTGGLEILAHFEPTCPGLDRRTGGLENNAASFEQKVFS